MDLSIENLNCVARCIKGVIFHTTARILLQCGIFLLEPKRYYAHNFGKCIILCGTSMHFSLLELSNQYVLCSLEVTAVLLCS